MIIHIWPGGVVQWETVALPAHGFGSSSVRKRGFSNLLWWLLVLPSALSGSLTIASIQRPQRAVSFLRMSDVDLPVADELNILRQSSRCAGKNLPSIKLLRMSYTLVASIFRLQFLRSGPFCITSTTAAADTSNIQQDKAKVRENALPAALSESTPLAPELSVEAAGAVAKL